MGDLLSIRGVSKRFGRVQILRQVSLEIGEGEFLTILGESGSGKTTLLRIISGLEQLDSGEIWMAGERFDTIPSNRRGVNTVFQQYALFPHLSVFDNVAYGLRAKHTPKSEISPRVTAALSQVNMNEFAGRAPSQLSGGQQQRVALARALVNRPKLLLLDEPLSALDANLRQRMQAELKSLQREVGIAFVFVTHDQEEAMALSDRIVLLNQGAVEQIATPREIYNHPATAYCATFIGQTNLIRARVQYKVAQFGSLAWPCEVPDGKVLFSIRPEHILLSSNLTGVRASVRRRVFGGPHEMIEVQTPEGLLLQVRTSSLGELPSEVWITFEAANAVLLPD